MKKIILIFFLFMIAQVLDAETKEEIIKTCAAFNEMLRSENDMTKIKSIADKISFMAINCGGCFCFSEALNIKAFMTEYNNFDESLKYFLKALKSQEDGTEESRKMAIEYLTKIITCQPEAKFIPYVFFLLAENYAALSRDKNWKFKFLENEENLEKAIGYYEKVALDYQDVAIKWPVGIFGMNAGESLGIGACFILTDIYCLINKPDKAVALLKKISDKIGSKADAKTELFVMTAKIKKLRIETGYYFKERNMDYVVNKEQAIKICKELLAVPDMVFTDVGYQSCNKGTIHCEALMELALLEDDPLYYVQVAVECPRFWRGACASEEGNSYGFFAVSELSNKNKIAPDKRISLLKKIIEKSADKYIKALAQQNIAVIYEKEKNDINMAIEEYKELERNYNIPYNDPEQLLDGRGFADDAREKIEQLQQNRD